MKGNEQSRFDQETFILDHFSYDWNGTLKIQEHNIDYLNNIFRGDKDSSVVIMKRSDYIEKLEEMIEDRVTKGTYTKNRRYNFTKFEKISIFFV